MQEIHRGVKDSIFRHDCRNQLMIRDIKCGIVDVDALGCHTLFVPHVGDFRGRTLFDADVGTGRGV